MQIAIDACVLVALINPYDLWHSRAHALLNAVATANLVPANFDCTVAEAASVLARRLHEKRHSEEVPVILDHLDAHIPAHLIIWILPDVPRLYPEILDLMRSSDGELNFNDALIALACREREIPLIASFDVDFDRIPWLRRVGGPEDV